MEANSLNTIPLNNVEAILNEYAQTVVNKYKQKLTKDGHIASGKLINSISYDVVFNNQQFNVNINLEPYYIYIENGRKPGKFPPPSSIEMWIKNKRIVPRATNGKLPTEKQLAFLIGRKIAKEGIKPGNQLHDTIEECNAIYLQRLQQALQQDFDAYANTIESEITNILSVF